jgi:hypothetical protein
MERVEAVFEGITMERFPFHFHPQPPSRVIREGQRYSCFSTGNELSNGFRLSKMDL